MKFKIKSKFKPSGDQPKAIKKLVAGLRKSEKHQTLLGITGSGKTFSISNVIEKVQLPTLVMVPNKTLAAQLAQEFREFFPNNAVEYFVSYYDFYQPEAYLPTSDTYIEKDAQVNEEIDKLRHKTTASLLSRNDVIVVASVSCIYGLGSPEEYRSSVIDLKVGKKLTREDLIADLVRLHYTRTEVLERSRFRVRGDRIEVVSPDENKYYQITLNDNVIGKIQLLDLTTRRKLEDLKNAFVFPAHHFIVGEDIKKKALLDIKAELRRRLKYFSKEKKLIETERLERRVRYDLEMIDELGYCSGIENYSRHLSGRKKGDPPYTLLDYFPKKFLLVMDESHVGVPQVRGMYLGDRARKKTLVEHGFRLPSALDNRPLTGDEFWEIIESRANAIYTSATPGAWEYEKSSRIVEQIIRPTGLIDPELVVRPVLGQVDDLLPRIRERIKKKERILVTTLTKKQAEDLADYLKEKKIKARFLHSDVKTLDRIRILEDLRKGEFDCLVGVNLLREGLDLPEVSLVAILDADKEGFLRSRTSLIQTIGRAARHIRGRVVLYADEPTGSLDYAIKETNRRRKLQLAYNKKHRITPKTVEKRIESFIDHELNPVKPVAEFGELEKYEDIPKVLKLKEIEMKELANNLEFEKASLIRDEIRELKRLVPKE